MMITGTGSNETIWIPTTAVPNHSTNCVVPNGLRQPSVTRLMTASFSLGKNGPAIQKAE